MSAAHTGARCGRFLSMALSLAAMLALAVPDASGR
jgi:hypothetical protein